MKEVEYFKWFTPPIGGGKPTRSRYEMDVATAQERFPGCKPDLSTRIVRMMPEPGDPPKKQHRCGWDGVG